MTSTFSIAGTELHSRFFLGTAGYPSPQTLQQAIAASGAQVVTVGLKRQLAPGQGALPNDFFRLVRESGARLLPNTAGCRSAREAVTLAQMARELFDTNWIKLEVVGDEHTLQPDPFELVVAATELCAAGFEVFPYCTDDLVSCQRLLDAGCRILMPWGAPIGSGQGLLNPTALRTLRDKLETVAWDKASLAAAMKETLAAHAIKMPAWAIPLRVIVAGRAQTPAIDTLLSLFQREIVLNRLRSI